VELLLFPGSPSCFSRPHEEDQTLSLMAEIHKRLCCPVSWPTVHSGPYIRALLKVHFSLTSQAKFKNRPFNISS
jgi:hypothetical protein